MRIAIKYDGIQLTSAGRVGGHEAADTLVRRLLRIFSDSFVVSPVARRRDGFDAVPLEMIDPAEAVVVVMDPLDAPNVWRVLSQYGEGDVEPRVMNFVWRSMPPDAPIERVATFALSCALFPTFANANRTAHEIREFMDRWTVKKIADKARLNWVNLGFRIDHIRPREYAEVPVVLYPSIYVTPDKRPDDFFAVVDRVRKQIPLRVDMRLQEDNLVSEKAMDYARKEWVWTGPLTATRESYWSALARTTAFLATAEDVSYGLMYVEALGAGVIGILPDKPWARALVPEDYPFVFRDLAEAETMLARALREPEACRRQLDEAAGGSFAEWIAEHHSDDAFDRAIRAAVEEWFGPVG